MNLWLFLLGVGILLITYYDFIYTSLSASGSGVIARTLSKGLWRILLRVTGGKGRSRLLGHAGVLSILLLLTAWLGLVWLGNTLLFLSTPDSVQDAASGQTATWVEKVYFVGYTLSTLGYGDFRPSSGSWQLLSVMVSFSGLSVLTIAISYLIQVLSSVTRKKSLSLFIATIGSTPADILLSSWNGKSFKRLEVEFAQLPTLILDHSQNHLAHPILHQFHSHQPSESTALHLAALDEALTILLLYIPVDNRPDEFLLRSLRRSLTQYLLTLENDFVRPAPQPLKCPDISPLRAKQIPLLPENEATQACWEELDNRRKLWQAILEYDGWTYQDLHQPQQQQNLDLKSIPYST